MGVGQHLLPDPSGAEGHVPGHTVAQGVSGAQEYPPAWPAGYSEAHHETAEGRKLVTDLALGWAPPPPPHILC